MNLVSNSVSFQLFELLPKYLSCPASDVTGQGNATKKSKIY